MKMVTGEMGSALNLMEQAKNEGAEDCWSFLANGLAAKAEIYFCLAFKTIG